MTNDLMNTFLTTPPAPPRAPRVPFIATGTHTLALEGINTIKDQANQRIAVATFTVLTSPVHPTGSQVCKRWNLDKMPDKAWKTAERADYIAFVKLAMESFGEPFGQQELAQSAYALSVSQSEGGAQEAQILRGLTISATGSAPSPSKDPTKQGYVVVNFTTMPQTKQALHESRKNLDNPTVVTQASNMPGPANATGGFLNSLK